MVAGLGAGLTSVVNAAIGLATSAYEAAKKALEINSPSKLFEGLGYGTGEGMVVGIDKSTSIVEDASENMAYSAYDAMRAALDSVAGSVNTEMDLTPTIRPVAMLTCGW